MEELLLQQRVPDVLQAVICTATYDGADREGVVLPLVAFGLREHGIVQVAQRHQN